MYQVHRLWSASEDLTDESLEAHHVEGAFVEVLVYVGTCIFLMFLLACNFNWSLPFFFLIHYSLLWPCLIVIIEPRHCRTCFYLFLYFILVIVFAVYLKDYRTSVTHIHLAKGGHMYIVSCLMTQMPSMQIKG